MVLETLLSFKRAGADLILTYHACGRPSGCGRGEQSGGLNFRMGVLVVR